MTHEQSQPAAESAESRDQTLDPRDAAIVYFGSMYQVLAARFGPQSLQAQRAWGFTLQATRNELTLSLPEATSLVLDVPPEPGTIAGKEIPLAGLAASATTGEVELVPPASAAEQGSVLL